MDDRPLSLALEDDHPHEECGVIGIFAPNEDVARMTFFGLFALQHEISPGPMGESWAGCLSPDGGSGIGDLGFLPVDPILSKAKTDRGDNK